MTLRNPFYSVLSLVAHLISLAVLFLLLTAAFLAAAQVVVYAGAVMVLYVFVVSYVGGSDQPLRPEAGGFVGMLGPLFALVLLVEITVAVVGLRALRARHQGRRRDERLRLAGRDRRAAAHPLPAAVRDRLVPAADRRRRARSSWRASAAGSRSPTDERGTIAVSDLMKSDVGNMPEAL